MVRLSRLRRSRRRRREGAGTTPRSAQGGSVIEKIQESPPVQSSTGLRTRVAGGVRWKLAGQATAQATSAAASIVLAHLLTPHEFGLAGMALVFNGIGA